MPAGDVIRVRRDLECDARALRAVVARQHLPVGALCLCVGDGDHRVEIARTAVGSVPNLETLELSARATARQHHGHRSGEAGPRGHVNLEWQVAARRKYSSEMIPVAIATISSAATMASMSRRAAGHGQRVAIVR